MATYSEPALPKSNQVESVTVLSTALHNICTKTRGDQENGICSRDDRLHDRTFSPDSVPNRLRVMFISKDRAMISLARSYDCSSKRDARGRDNWDVSAG